MTKAMDTWFFMRPGFTKFRMEPEKDPQYLFGSRDRKQRDLLLGSLEEASYSRDGHKAAVYGDYGRGKTHQCHNIIYQLRRRNLPIVPVYIKCAAYGTKEQFQTFFRELILGHRSEDLNRIAEEYKLRVKAGNAMPLLEIVQSEDIAKVMTTGLGAPEPDLVRNSMRWLGGEPKVPMGIISKSLQPQLSDSREFGAVMRGLAHMYLEIDEKVPLYLIDEAERFQNITQPDAFFSWAATIRELVEIPNVGFLFLIGAKTRNDLPVLFVQDEIIRRIGVTNYVEFTNPNKEILEEFVLELLQTVIRKGDVPEQHRDIVLKDALDATIPAELRSITKGDDERLRTFPFEPDAFIEFIEQTTGELASKPSEVLIRLQKGAQRAMRFDQRTISKKIVLEITSEGF